MIAGTLEIQLLANMARLQKDMDDAKRAVGGAMASIESSVASAKAVLGTLGAGLSILSFANMIRGSVDAADKLNDLSKTTMLAVDTLAGLKLAAKQSGGDLDGIAASINKLAVAMGKSGDKFAALGVTAKDPLEAFKQLSDVFAAIKDPQLRAALGAEALGKSWQSAAPLLSEGSKKIGEMVEKGRALSGITKEMTDRADEFNDKLAELQTATDGAKMKLAGEMLPAMIEVTKAITEAYTQSGKLSAIWVGLGATGAFLFTNEFSSATVKIRDATKELEEFKKNQQDLQGADSLTKWIYGSTDLDAKIKATQEKIQGLRNEIDRPAREAAAKAADKAAITANAKEAAAAAEKAQAFLDYKDESEKNAARAAALAKAETSLYTSSLQSLEQQLGKINEQTQVQKTQYQLLSGSLQTLSAAHGKHLLQIAKEIDLKAQWAAVSKAALDYAKELTAEQERADAVLASFNSANSDYLQQLEFEISLIRLTAGARELATAERKLDMDYQRAQIGLNEQELATLTALYREQKAKLSGAVGSKVSAQAIFDNQEEAKKQLDAFFDPTKAQTFGEALKGAFGGAAESMGRLSSVLQAYGIKQAEIDKARTAAGVAYANDAGKLAQAQQAITEKEFATRIGGYADMAGAAKGFFKEGSDGYKTLDGVSQAFHAVQIAMNLIEMGQLAVKAVLNQASGGDVYSALPRMAAMAAAVAALGFAVGGGFSDGGGAAVSSADRQKSQGTGTVLGDSTAKSNSLLAALEAMEKNTFTQLKYSSGMLDALKSIQRSMAGLSQIIFRTTGLTSGNAFGVQEGTIKQGSIGQDLFGSTGAGVEKLLKLGRPELFGLGSVIDKLWGKTVQTITDSGLSINGALGDLTQGRGFGQYANVQQTQSSWFGLKKTTTNSTRQSALDQAAADQLAGVFAGISDSLRVAAGTFGADTDAIAAQLAASVISIPAVSLRGLKGQELQDALNAVFSGAADNLARTVAPGFAALQKTGEGYYETVIRASNSLATANGQLDRLHLRLFTVSVAGAVAATSLADLFGGLNEFNAASQAFYESYFTEAERAAQSTKDMAQALATVNLSLPGSKDELRALAGTLDLNTEAGRKAYQVLLSLAPEFAANADRVAKFAKDTAAKLLLIFTAGPLVPALRAISSGLTGAQAAGDLLVNEIEQLRQGSNGARIDIAGLSAALAKVDTATFEATVTQVFENLASRITGVINSIASERIAVREAALQIIDPAAMSLDAIRRGIAGVNTTMPGNSGVLAAQQSLAAADAAASQASAALASAKAPAPDRTAMDSAAAAWMAAADQVGHYTPSDLVADLASRWNVVAHDYARQLYAYTNVVADAQTQLAAASTTQTAAVSLARQQQLAYAAALQNFSLDASKSVTRLTRLREETMKYYGAQKQLADLMTASATALRESIRATRFGQLDSTQALAERQRQFASNYSLALSTTGAAQAGYADKLSAQLPELSAALMDASGSRSEWVVATAKLFRQSETIAAQLAANTPKDYAADSLAMLANIDATLLALDASSKSAEKIIADAVAAGSEKTAAGLRAVIAALTGQAIPAFATGGTHSGGLRIVGENGPELEATGPSRVYSAAQTRSLLAGGGTQSNQRLEALVERLTTEVEGLRAETRATAVHTAKTSRILSRVTRDGESLQTTVAV